MENSYSILEWDSQFFGYKVARLKTRKINPERMNEIIADMHKNNVSLIYCFADPDDELSNQSILNNHGFLVDEKITFFTETKKDDNFTSSDNIMPYKLNYSTQKLKLLALQSGLYSRFKVDTQFNNGEFQKLYLEWIEKSVKKIISSEILVYYRENDEKGFVSLDIKAGIGSIGLIAVDELERGNSIGKQLMSAALYFFKNRNINKIEVVTQKANAVACKFYKSLGFEVKRIENVYHIWIK